MGNEFQAESGDLQAMIENPSRLGASRFFDGD
jgi:hypothetical protein